MRSVVTHALLPFFFFPLAIWAVWQGDIWPVAYVIMTFLLYVGVDNLTPPITSTPNTPYAKVYNLYNLLLLLQVPLSSVVFVVLIAKLGAGSVGTELLSSVTGLHFVGFNSLGEALLASVAAAYVLSTNKVIAHEFSHRSCRFLRACSRFLLTMVGDPQFLEAHVYGHHTNVGTLRDPATARRGESFYRFLPRSTVGQCAEAYQFERMRLRGRIGIGKLVRHRVLRAHLVLATLLALTWVFFGFLALIGWLIIIAVTIVMLELINYIQHYGLVRASGEKVQAAHSFDCSSRLSSVVLYNLTRHSEHHMAPAQPFWELHNQPSAPNISHGYIFTMCLALVPPLWFRYADSPSQPAAAQAEAPGINTNGTAHTNKLSSA